MVTRLMVTHLKGELASHLGIKTVTRDLRVVYRPISKDQVLFLDIGSHSQVY